MEKELSQQNCKMEKAFKMTFKKEKKKNEEEKHQLV